MNKSIVLFLKKNSTDLDRLRSHIVELTGYSGINDADVYECLLRCCFEFLNKDMMLYMFNQLGRNYKVGFINEDGSHIITKYTMIKLMSSTLQAEVLSEQLK